VLAEISKLTRNELMVQQSRRFRAHQLDWNKTKFKFGFSADFLEQVECAQFCLSTGKGRVHGFLIGNRFYIVWLDPHHNMYPEDTHHVKYCDTPINQYEDLAIKHTYLEKQVDKLSKENKELWGELGKKIG
jgi:hypothetical protein